LTSFDDFSVTSRLGNIAAGAKKKVVLVYRVQ
jgi:hypothetical protein